MATIRIPSASLLRAFLKPSTCSSCQIRSTSDWMPRKKYGRIGGLEKLHRKQKKESREERLATEARASLITKPTTPQDPSVHPFKIARTTTNNIPVYHDSKAGGNKHITLIRKVSGDVEALCTQLKAVLGLRDDYTDPQGRKKQMIHVNQLTGHVIVNGWRGPEVKAWAASLGF